LENPACLVHCHRNWIIAIVRRLAIAPAIALRQQTSLPFVRHNAELQEPEMTDVTMIGLGAMGSALARTFIGAGHSVTVWNRTADRMQPLVSLGATAANAPDDAAKASPVFVVCIDNYGATRRLIEEAGMLEPLAGRTLVQLSTGTPAEARDFSGWLATHGVNVLDGAIQP
jgi:3-hydroxyisobutyrate dehydrogenase-like beta-hydroxyacid dehydrogenase